MKHDRISVFNQLTSSELADYSGFEQLIDLHYLKFNYFFTLLNKIDTKLIDHMNCDMSTTSLEIDIFVKDNNIVSKLKDKMIENTGLYKLRNNFDVQSFVSEGMLTLIISSVNISDEGVLIYAGDII